MCIFPKEIKFIRYTSIGDIMDTTKNTKKIAKIFKKITTWQQKVVKLEAKEKKNNLDRVFDSWSSDILATYRFLYTMYIRTFFIMSIFSFFLLLTVVKYVII